MKQRQQKQMMQPMEKDYVKVWEDCLLFIEDNLAGKENERVFDTWFRPIVPVRLDGSTLTIQVPSQFFYEWLEQNYVKLLKDAIRLVLGNQACLQYSIVMDTSISEQPITTSVPSTGHPSVRNQMMDMSRFASGQSHELINPFAIPGLKKMRVDSQLSASYTLANYVEGECNRLARAVGEAVAAEPGETAYNPLVLYGGVGLGKTHLANAIGLRAKELHPEKQVVFVTSEQFMQQFADAGRDKTTSDFIHFYEMMDMLIIDDIQFWANKAPKTQEAFFHIFNTLHQSHKQLIITSDKAPSELQGLEVRLLSRFKWGLVAEIQQPDVETRMRILRQKLANEGMEMPDEVIEYIAYNISTNVREMEGALTALMAESSFIHKDITIDLARQMVDKLVKSTARELTIDYIQKVVCDYFNLPVDCIQSATRKREIVQARQFTMYFARKLTGLSAAVIGTHCGNRDHATVLHARKTIENLAETDRQTRDYLADLERKFKE